MTWTCGTRLLALLKRNINYYRWGDLPVFGAGNVDPF